MRAKLFVSIIVKSQLKKSLMFIEVDSLISKIPNEIVACYFLVGFLIPGSIIRYWILKSGFYNF